MPIIFNCPSCGKRFEVGEALAGKRVRCKVCGLEMRVPGEPQPASAAKPRSKSRKDDPFRRSAPASEKVDPFGFEDAPLPPRGAIRPEQAYVAPQEDPEFAPLRRAPAFVEPRKGSSKGRDSSDEIPPLSMLVSVLFWILAGVGFIPVLILVGIGVTHGRPGVHWAILAFLSLYAGFVAFIHTYLKLFLFMARQGSHHVLAVLFIPGYAFFFIIQQREEVRRSFFKQMNVGAGLWILAAVFGGIMMVKYPLKPKPKQAAAAQNPQVATRQAIKLIVTGVPSQDAAAIITEKFKAMIDPADRQTVGSAFTGGTATYTAALETDPAEFADRITFGTVTKVEGRVITVEAGPLDEDEVATQAAIRTRREAEHAAVVARAEANRPGPDPEPPADADTVTRLLFGLKSSSPHKRKDAAVRLARMRPIEDRREEVHGALMPLLDDPDGFVVSEAMRAMVDWRTDETVPALIHKTTDDRFGVRWNAIETLGRLRDPRAAEAIAARLVEDPMKSEAALRAIGPAAEPAVLPLLSSSEPEVRRKACEVLTDIGGKETLAFMQKARPDADFGVRVAAQRAMKAIAARVSP